MFLVVVEEKIEITHFDVAYHCGPGVLPYPVPESCDLAAVEAARSLSVSLNIKTRYNELGKKQKSQNDVCSLW
jgi:hypothetical protein